MILKEPLQGKRRHKLLPKEVADTMPMLRSQDGKGMEAIVHLKLFTPYGRGTWYITEASALIDGQEREISLKDAFTPGALSEERIDDIQFFGYCVSPLGPDCDEWGYASFNELANIRVFNIMPGIERDCHYSGIGKTVRECLEDR